MNIYKAFPADLGGWERPFASILDLDQTGIVQWWHRNPDRKPYSVGIPVPGYENYCPDFIIGVKDREYGEGELLVETNERINDSDGLAQAKTQVVHPAYRKRRCSNGETGKTSTPLSIKTIPVKTFWTVF